jgi:hypothetical protein
MYMTYEDRGIVHNVSLEAIAEDASLSKVPEVRKVGWYTNYFGVRGDFAIKHGLVVAEPLVQLDYTQPTEAELIQRYGANHDPMNLDYN